jgi:hypothetical protein
MHGERFLANENGSRREIHDLDNESDACRIDEILHAGHDQPYTTLFAAHRDGYDNCTTCLRNSMR